MATAPCEPFCLVAAFQADYHLTAMHAPIPAVPIDLLGAQERDRYRLGLLRQAAMRDASVAHRRERAWIVAREGARRLRERFGASEVRVFGSLATGRGFHQRSDIDLAVRGVRREDYLQAVVVLLDLDRDFLVDLVLLDDATEGLREHILTEGAAL